MTVASSVNKVQYNCNGSVTAFSFSFRIFETGDLKVILLNKLTGVETTLTETSDYTVSASGNDYTSGGTVTTVQTYSSDYGLTIKRELELTQEADYREGDSFPAESHENALDKQTMISQQLNEAIRRCLTFPETEGNTDTKLPDVLLRKGKVFSFDSVTGEPIAEFTLTDLQSALDYAAAAAASASAASADADDAEVARASAVIARLASELAASQCTNASNLSSGTVDGDRLPAMSETKKGAVPPVGAAPDGTKYLANDGTFKTLETSSLLQDCNGRLTLLSGVPVTTSDITAATTLYFTPYKGNKIALYDGANWSVSSFTELSLSLSGYAASKPYDIWIYNNSGTLTLDSTVWTDSATRTTALVAQDGVYVKSGDPTRRYLGTIGITAVTGQCEDSTTKRLVWNYYNQEEKHAYGVDGTAHTYTTAVLRKSPNFVDMYLVSGLTVCVDFAPATYGTNMISCMGINGSVSPYGTYIGNGVTVATVAHNQEMHYVMGMNYFSMLEYGAAGGSATWHMINILYKC